MIIVADDSINELDHLFSAHQLIKLPAELITHEELRRADILLIRSVTQVNEHLLSGTRVCCVGTITSGTDHLDLPWLAKQGIAWFSAHGANAPTVVEYVLCCLVALRSCQLLSERGGRAGVIGAGAVGSKVVAALRQLGFSVVVNDPLLASRDANFVSTPLTAFVDLDLICVHAELTFTGPYPSYHLLDNAFFQRQKPGCVLINAARGGVIATEVLLANPHICLCLDVWEHEPLIDVSLLQQATIATPHIAGYSLAAKQRAVSMIYSQMHALFNWPGFCFRSDLIVTADKQIALDDKDGWQVWAQEALDVLTATAELRQHVLAVPANQRGEVFKTLRRPYSTRQEFLIGCPRS